MFAARADRALPKGYSDALLQMHDRKPYAATPEEIAALARELRDANFRIEVRRTACISTPKGSTMSRRRHGALPASCRRT